MFYGHVLGFTGLERSVVVLVREIEQAGITHIVDNRGEWSDEPFVMRYTRQIRYLHNGQDDAGQRMPDSWFETGVGFALDALRTPGSAVLAHCHMGINRGPSMAYAILLAQGWDPVDALTAIRAARPIAAFGYAHDTLDWWHRVSRTARDQVLADRAAVRQWFQANPLVVRVIRRVREEERRSA